MSKKSRSSEPPHGKGPSRHEGTEQHGWSPDVDETHQQDNPSAHRSFRAAEHAEERGRGRTKSAEEKKAVPGDTVKSHGARGEEYGDSDEKGRHDTGRRGRSQRPSGTRDASSSTGVDPQDSPPSPPSGRRQG
ncbi:hypothetical protein OG920_01845 [Streptomyces europaeiscabiei]|uniref:hypothetical protein n=1 Tax=Streptomyces TaxID=1883 RepID=UPI000A3A5F73|nr:MULTISPECIES: hypothetical protein [Streptomyces]MDX3612238.1 hypothetical protein [Streptomyces europaeiscabiei]MDX3637178.1 hypothetical protein [Streptomyces europaeiscabiei]MDX3654830.1 hypothetical protein [Streptomyces europaeiscabiei]WUD30286.1 hypothetical protein OG858_01905 [Streptomyces europaeiscabiei]